MNLNCIARQDFKPPTLFMTAKFCQLILSADACNMKKHLILAPQVNRFTSLRKKNEKKFHEYIIDELLMERSMKLLQLLF